MPSELALKVLEKIFKETETNSSSMSNEYRLKHKEEDYRINRVYFDDLFDDNQNLKPQPKSNEKAKHTNKMSLEELSKL